ncbi:hypothetical protein Cpap_3356 [Ruminiclostridium papyrosolvens DSM 2782]|uniref:Integrase catalytic domain-containing protein n=1 Tax=Ruminiclostridium papyrosolvens DSM 2782 TaxID=588581 RepID=F1T8U7_9FIRM|nr:DDE-type integrase/transposase/recombinase [Ruminiclostridium papyrosolvens]EGD48929.1 hypothetical protein Cpap_3356 [Ruminiclostridium papyrosolvens DSM 2782]WES35413.1 DDE-type integrase/transposase/recombinase [Ruminiclostridium papyrosolvens DSM 2782]
MNSIITVLIAYNQFLLSQIHKLLVFIAKNIPLNAPKNNFTSPKYNKYSVDKAPIIKHFDRFDYKKLLAEYEPVVFICPHCGHTLELKKTVSILIFTNASTKPFVDNFDYKPSNHLAADETYTKVKGDRHYVWFVMDALKKSILGYQISYTRDIGPCVLAMRMAFSKFKQFPGKTLKFAADGYTTYKLAQQLFSETGMDFNLIQVIGLTNADPVSTEYRWLKQIIERFNRTFKFSYQVTNGYGSREGSKTHVALFVAYYNFLRPHPYTYWQPLNSIPELDKLPNMPAKWQKLIELSQQLTLSKQSV